MNARVQEIAVMIREALNANRKPVEIDASAFADQVEMIGNFELRIRASGKLVSEGLGQNVFKKIMPDVRYAEIWMNVGEDSIFLKTKLVGTLPTGEEFEYPLFEVFHVTGGVIDRMDFYTCAQREQKFIPFTVAVGYTPGDEVHISQVYPQNS